MASAMTRMASMMTPMTARMAWPALALALLVAPARAEPTAPPQVAALLDAVQTAAGAGDAAAAMAAVEGYTGPAHPLAALARGHALTLAERHAEAAEAYRAALAGDADLRPAGLGLVGALARLERWEELTAELPRWVHAAEADDRTLRLWLAAALGAGDALLAEEIARRGMVRFPADPLFRRGLAHALLATGRPVAAAAALRRLLVAAPTDAELWQRLAAADPAVARPALEAAVLADPDDLEARARLVGALIAADHGPAALRYAKPLAARGDRLLAVRAAVAAGDMAQAAAWLEGVSDRGPVARRLAARIALARGDREAARAALAALLADGHEDARVQLAALERAAGRLDRAEALLRQALPGPAAGPAALHLGHLLIERGRRAEAAAILRRHLAAHPADGAARALLEAIE